MKFTKRNKIITGFAIIVCLITGTIVVIKNSGITGQTPSYKTTLPEGKTIQKLGGWKRVSPAGKDPVFAYIDSLEGVPISVSEQPLPRSFKNDASNKVSELAEKFNATEKIEVNGTTIHIGTSSKGPQSIIFSKNDVLILIKSKKKVSNKTWVSYVSSFQ